MLSIPVAVIARLGPWLGRLGGAALSRIYAAIRSSGGPALNSVQGVVDYVKASPANAVLVFSSIASLGIGISDLFSPEDKTTADGRSIATSLAVMEAQASNLVLLPASENSETLKGISGNRTELKALQRTLAFAVGHYGSKSAAREAHVLHQAFFELSLDDLDAGFDVLDI